MLRSCYTTTARFFRNSDAETQIRYYFTAPDAPFVPNSGPFDSRNWESDPKGEGHLGEVVGAPREWCNGEPPGVFAPGYHLCGTAEQWSNGDALPPETPVELDGQGIPVCCGETDLNPLHSLVWNRPDELEPRPEGDPVLLHPPAEGTFFPLTSPLDEFHPTFMTDPATGKRGLAYTRAADFQTMHWEPIPFPGDFTLFVISRPDNSAFAGDFPGWFIGSDAGDQIVVRRQQIILTKGATTHTLPFVTHAAGTLRCHCIKRQGTTVTITVNGVLVTTDGPWEGTWYMDVFGPSESPPVTLNFIWIGEIKIFPRALNTSETAGQLAEFAEQFGFTVGVP